MYFYVVVMSLFQRYSDPKDPIHPDYEKRMKRMRNRDMNLAEIENEEEKLQHDTKIVIAIASKDEL